MAKSILTWSMSNGHYRPVLPCPSDPLIIISILPLAVPAAGMTMHGSDVKSFSLSAQPYRRNQKTAEGGWQQSKREKKLIGKWGNASKEALVSPSHSRKFYQDKKKGARNKALLSQEGLLYEVTCRRCEICCCLRAWSQIIGATVKEHRCLAPEKRFAQSVMFDKKIKICKERIGLNME